MPKDHARLEVEGKDMKLGEFPPMDLFLSLSLSG